MSSLHSHPNLVDFDWEMLSSLPFAPCYIQPRLLHGAVSIQLDISLLVNQTPTIATIAGSSSARTLAARPVIYTDLRTEALLKPASSTIRTVT